MALPFFSNTRLRKMPFDKLFTIRKKQLYPGIATLLQKANHLTQSNEKTLEPYIVFNTTSGKPKRLTEQGAIALLWELEYLEKRVQP